MKKKMFTSRGVVLPEKTEVPMVVPTKVPLQEKYFLPLPEGYQLRVQLGDAVLGGQILAEELQNDSIVLRSPTSGIVIEVRLHPWLHQSALLAPVVILESDGKDQHIIAEPLSWESCSLEIFQEHVRSMGIVGLGGASFPTYRKLPGTECRVLIVNAVECESHISCDDCLMQNYAYDIIHGAVIMQHMLATEECIIAVEDNKARSFSIMQETLHNYQKKIPFVGRIVSIPTQYPNGDAKQLTYILLGLEVPHGHHLVEYGVQCFNVGTLYAVAQACAGYPLLSRLVTVTGHVQSVGNYWVSWGVPIQNILMHAQIYPEYKQVVIGGSMMGFVLQDEQAPMTSTVNCLLVHAPNISSREEEKPCIRCTACVDVCPAELQPHEMYWWSRAQKWDNLEDYNLFDCIECGSCSYVCPSHIPLVDYYQFAKSEIRYQKEKEQRAEQAKIAYERRQERLERIKQAREERIAERMKERLSNHDNQQLIQAALQRVQRSQLNKEEE